MRPDGVVLEATIYRVLEGGATVDVYLHGSFACYGLTGKAVAGGVPREEADPTQHLGAGLSGGPGSR